jgi:hypothetical protein
MAEIHKTKSSKWAVASSHLDKFLFVGTWVKLLQAGNIKTHILVSETFWGGGGNSYRFRIEFLRYRKTLNLPSKDQPVTNVLGNNLCFVCVNHAKQIKQNMCGKKAELYVLKYVVLIVTICFVPDCTSIGWR